MLSFETPGYLVLLAVLPFAIYLRHFRRGRGGHIAFPFTVWRGGGFDRASRGTKALLFVGSLSFWAGVAFLVLALAGPVWTNRERIFISRGLDIVFVLDESPSMFAQDFGRESRYDAAKQVIVDFVHRRENDAIGLVTFAKDAILRVPPTLDYRTLLDELSSLHPGTLGNGTAIGMGIAVACLHLRDSTAKQRIIVLLTDGENNAGTIQPLQSATIAADLGIRIYAIGIGGSGEAPIEYTDPETGKRYSGVLSGAYDARLLQDIAETTGGRYFGASSSDALERILKVIDSMESIEQRVTIRTTTTPNHRIFIILGLLCVLGDFAVRKVLLREVIV